MRMQTKSCIMVMKKRYVNALLLGMSLCVAAPGTAVSASEIPAQESAVEDTSDAELEAIMREAEAAAAGADDISYWKKFFRHFFAKIFLPPKIPAY